MVHPPHCIHGFWIVVQETGWIGQFYLWTLEDTSASDLTRIQDLPGKLHAEEQQPVERTTYHCFSWKCFIEMKKKKKMSIMWLLCIILMRVTVIHSQQFSLWKVFICFSIYKGQYCEQRILEIFPIHCICLDMVTIMSWPIHNQYIAHHDTMLL